MLGDKATRAVTDNKSTSEAAEEQRSRMAKHAAGRYSTNVDYVYEGALHSGVPKTSSTETAGRDRAAAVVSSRPEPALVEGEAQD